jgi:hypothetical protein
MLSEYVVDVANTPWKRGDFGGLTFSGQVLLTGEDGGPEALRFRFDDHLSVYAHMHLTSQFQVLINGEMDMPRGASKYLRPLAIHYTDHNVPYGPFSTADGHDMLVLHPKAGGLISMANLEARRQIHLGGRLYAALASEREWVPVAGEEDGRGKVLIPGELGPEALLLELPPDIGLASGIPSYGRYEVVLEGSVIWDGREIGPPGFRYVRGDEPAAPLCTGPRGATVALLSFDQDALEGGLTGEGIAVEAAEMLARAI